MSVRVTFLAGEPAPAPASAAAVLAPRDAVRRDSGRDYAWVVTEGRLRRQAVTTGRRAAATSVVVEPGLLGGEALVTGDGDALSEGQRVEVASTGSAE